MENKIWLKQSPLSIAEGSTLTYSVVYEGATSVSSPSLAVYSKNANVTTALAPSGSTTASGNIVTLKPIVIPANPNAVYIVVITATVDGNMEVRKLQLNVSKASSEQ